MPTYRNDGSVTHKVRDINGNSCMVPPGFSVQSYREDLPAEMVKTSDEPYFPVTKVFESAFASPGTKTGLTTCSIIRLTASVSGITIRWNNASNPNILTLPAGQPVDFENLGEIGSIVFTGAGSVKIEGF